MSDHRTVSGAALSLFEQQGQRQLIQDILQCVVVGLYSDEVGGGGGNFSLEVTE